MKLTPDPRVNARKRGLSAAMKRKVSECPACKRRGIFRRVKPDAFTPTVIVCHYCRHEW